jgi:hypothetical protein
MLALSFSGFDPTETFGRRMREGQGAVTFGVSGPIPT